MRGLSSALGLAVVAALAVPASAAGAGLPGTLSQSGSSPGCLVNGDGPALSNCTNTGRAMANLRSVVVSPDGRNVYGSASDDNALAIFDRDPANGRITQKPGGAGCIVDAP